MIDSKHAPDDPVKAIAGFFMIFALYWIVVHLESWYGEFQRGHRRAALLKAYRNKGRWRKADVAKLCKLGVSAPAEKLLRKLESEKGRGRGVVSNYRSPDEFLASGVQHVDAFLSAETAPHVRLQLLKSIPLMWPYLVEALYRGEHCDREAAGEKAASDKAVQVVADVLGLSAASVRKTCTKVRKQTGNAYAEFPTVTLSDFGIWQHTGAIFDSTP
jgi:hypothetical protein